MMAPTAAASVVIPVSKTDRHQYLLLFTRMVLVRICKSHFGLQVYFPAAQKRLIDHRNIQMSKQTLKLKEVKKLNFTSELY